MPPRLTAWMASSVGVPLSLSWDVGAPAEPGRRRVAAPVALLGESYRLLESTAPNGCRHGEGEWLRGVHRLRTVWQARHVRGAAVPGVRRRPAQRHRDVQAVSYTHLRAHETRHDLVCRLLLEKKKNKTH